MRDVVRIDEWIRREGWRWHGLAHRFDLRDIHRQLLEAPRPRAYAL